MEGHPEVLLGSEVQLGGQGSEVQLEGRESAGRPENLGSELAEALEVWKPGLMSCRI